MDNSPQRPHTSEASNDQPHEICDEIFELPLEIGLRLEEVLKGREITPQYEGFTDEEAIEIISLLNGFDHEIEAREVLAISRGESDGDCIAIDEDSKFRMMKVWRG